MSIQNWVSSTYRFEFWIIITKPWSFSIEFWVFRIECCAPRAGLSSQSWFSRLQFWIIPQNCRRIFSPMCIPSRGDIAGGSVHQCVFRLGVIGLVEFRVPLIGFPRVFNKLMKLQHWVLSIQNWGLCTQSWILSIDSWFPRLPLWIMRIQSWVSSTFDWVPKSLH